MKIGEKVLMLHNYYISNMVCDNAPAVELVTSEVTNSDKNTLMVKDSHLTFEIKENGIAYGYKRCNGCKPVINANFNNFIKTFYTFWYHVMDNRQSIKFLQNLLDNKRKCYNGCPIYIYPKKRQGKNGEKFKSTNDYIQYLINELSK